MGQKATSIKIGTPRRKINGRSHERVGEFLVVAEAADQGTKSASGPPGPGWTNRRSVSGAAPTTQAASIWRFAHHRQPGHPRRPDRQGEFRASGSRLNVVARALLASLAGRNGPRSLRLRPAFPRILRGLLAVLRHPTFQRLARNSEQPIRRIPKCLKFLRRTCHVVSMTTLIAVSAGASQQVPQARQTVAKQQPNEAADKMTRGQPQQPTAPAR